MNKYKIYYCIDNNLWYIDVDVKKIKNAESLTQTFDTENDALEFFKRDFDGFLSAQKSFLKDRGEKIQSFLNVCYLQTSYGLFDISNYGVWKFTAIDNK